TLARSCAGSVMCLGRLSARWPRDQICNSLLCSETARYDFLRIVGDGPLRGSSKDQVAAAPWCQGRRHDNAVAVGVPARVLSYTGSAKLIRLLGTGWLTILHQRFVLWCNQ